MTRKRHKLTLHLAVGLVVLCLSGTTSRAQPTTGSIFGQVIDPSALPAPRAAVTVTNELTGIERCIVTDASGNYAAANLPPATYSIAVEAPGFRKLDRGPISLVVDQKLRLDLRLEVGDITDVVTISAPAPGIETVTGATGEVIQSVQILDLPLLGRDFLELARLSPGVTAGSGGNNANLSISGQREFANSLLVDGIEVTGNRNNDTSLRPSVDAVQEFKVLTSGYAPEFGRASGGVIAVQTKSGGNEIHGTLYEFLRPQTTAAQPFFSKQQPQLKQNNFGGSAGGPLRKNHSFLFLSYEGVRLRDAFSFLDTTIPKSQLRFAGGGADLAGLRDPATGNPVPIFDPDSYAENFQALRFPNNVIPASRLSPGGRATVENFFPAPNRAGNFHGWFSNFLVNQRYRYDSDTIDARADHTVANTGLLSFVYHARAFQSLQGDRFEGAIPVPGGGDADQGDQTGSGNQTVGVAYSRQVSPFRFNELRAGYSRFDLEQLSLMHGRRVAEQFGIPNVNLESVEQTSGFPYVFLGFGAQTGGSTFKPLRFLDSNFQVVDNYTWRLGKHEMKMGADVRLLASNPDFSLFPTGFQFYAGAGSSLTADPGFSFFDPNAMYFNGGNEIADLLLGLPLTVTTGLQLSRPRVRSHEVHWYWQNAWQAGQRLTLTYGIRYEYQAPFTERADQAANLDLATRSLLIAGRGANRRSLVAPDRNNFAPRLGFAYRLGEQTVLRGGYGVFHTPENSARNEVLTKNYPFATRQDFFNDIFGFYSGAYKVYQLDTGVPRSVRVPLPAAVAAIDPSALKNGKSLSLFALDPNFRTGYAQLFNLSVQRELAASTILEAGYGGSLGRKLPYAVGDVNLQSRLADDLGKIEAQFPIGLSNYHSLQVKAERRFLESLSAQVAFTLSKSIDNGPAPFNLGRANQRPQDPFDLRAERAVSANDARHNLVVSGTWELPFGRGRRFLQRTGWIGEAILGGWQVNGILSIRSGLPANVIRSGQRRGFEGLRPNVLRDPSLAGSEQTLERWFDASAFSVMGLADTQPGNAGRNLIRGPSVYNLDFSLFKEAPLRRRGEGPELQLRFAFFNVTNTPHFDRPNTDLSRGDFASITRTIGNPRIIQFAAKIVF